MIEKLRIICSFTHFKGTYNIGVIVSFWHFIYQHELKLYLERESTNPHTCSTNRKV